jgi:hypothetical protein
MLLGLTYCLLFLFFLVKSPNFKEELFSKKFISIIFVLKLTGIFFYLITYAEDTQNLLFNNDTQSILKDANIIYSSLLKKPGDYFSMIFGMYDGNASAYFDEQYFSKMEKWYLIGKSDFLLNDNQIITRINAVLLTLSFGQFYALIVLNCILSFTGSFLLYKTFKIYFPNKEKLLILLLLFIPSVYFWTSAVLKEPIVFFFLGVFIWSFFILIIRKTFSYTSLILFVISFFCLTQLKPYLLVVMMFPLTAFTIIEFKKIKKIYLTYFILIGLGISLTVVVSSIVFNKQLFSIIAKRQNDFVSIGYGGTFLYQNGIYLRIENNDIKKLKLQDRTQNTFTLTKGISYMYWHYPNLKDTFFVVKNNDTLTAYELRNTVVASHSLIEKRLLEPTFTSYLKLLPNTLYNSFFYPFFIECKTTVQYLASIENFIYFLFLIVAIIYHDKKVINKNLLLFFIASVVLLFLLIGHSTAIGGALVRYKVPFLPFLWMIPLLIIDVEKCKGKFIFWKK